MSEEISQVEQITREPSVKTKVKDPKRVQAGKTLSEKNKRAREALKREEEREKKESEKEENKGSSVGGRGDWIPKYMPSQTIFLAIGAIGLAAYSLWTNYRDRIPDLHFPPITLKSKPSQPKVTESQPATEETDLKDDLL